MSTVLDIPTETNEVNNNETQQHVEAITNIAMNCNEVVFSVSWFSQSRQVDAETKAAMAAVVAGQSKGFGVSKRLLSSSHPLLSELNAARRTLNAWRDSYTIVKAGGGVQDNAIEGGVRLIRVEDISEFERGFRHRRDELYRIADRVQEHMNQSFTDVDGQTYPPILELERQRLGAQFAAKDYPQNLRAAIFVSDPAYRSYAPSVRLPNDIYQRECRRVANEIDRTIETATAYVVDEIQTAFETLSNQLVSRIRLHVHEDDTEMRRFDQGEIVRQTTAADGTVTVRIRYRVDDNTAKSGKKSVVEDMQFPSEEAFKNRMHPLETNERKVITTSSIEHILEKLSQFGRVKTMLGQQGNQMDTVLNQVRAQFSSVGSTAVDIAKEFKNSPRTRRQLASALNDAVENLLDQAEDVKRVRRAVNLESIRLWEKE